MVLPKKRNKYGFSYKFSHDSIEVNDVNENELTRLLFHMEDDKQMFQNNIEKNNENHFCPQGYEYIEHYKKKDGTYVKGFCRKK